MGSSLIGCLCTLPIRKKKILDPLSISWIMRRYSSVLSAAGIYHYTSFGLIVESCSEISDLTGQISLFYFLGHHFWWDRKCFHLSFCYKNHNQALDNL